LDCDGECTAQSAVGDGRCDEALNCDALQLDGCDCALRSDCSWEIPNCYDECVPFSQLGDGRCDRGLNCAETRWDEGDCAGACPSDAYRDCLGGCQPTDASLGNGVCDPEWDCVQHALDAGDCAAADAPTATQAGKVRAGAALLEDLFVRYAAIQATTQESLPLGCDNLLGGSPKGSRFLPQRYEPQHGFVHHSFDAVGETCAFRFLPYRGGGHLLVTQYVGQDEMGGEFADETVGGDTLSSIIRVLKRSETGTYSRLSISDVFGMAEPLLLTFSAAGEVLVTTIDLDTVPYTWTGKMLVPPAPPKRKRKP